MDGVGIVTRTIEKCWINPRVISTKTVLAIAKIGRQPLSQCVFKSGHPSAVFRFIIAAARIGVFTIRRAWQFAQGTRNIKGTGQVVDVIKAVESIK